MTATPSALPPPTVPGLSGLSVVARGGYATVYRAMQDSVSREVAVKVENRTLESDRDQRRFLREARAAGRMSSHPHVVDLFDAGVTADGHPYLIMELCDGSYAERMKAAPLRPTEVRDIGVKIADALADAHALGVLHRDVKPANILITRFGEPALADFGLAILAEARDTSVTMDVLTPAYAPPELFRHRPPSEAVDVYALSATLYALLQGRPPCWREDRNPSLVTLLDLFGEPVPDLPGVPPELVDVLRAGMGNDPLTRPTAAELRDRLAALAIVPAPTERPTGRAAVVPPQGRPSTVDNPTVTHNPWPGVVSLIIAGAALAGIIALAINFAISHLGGTSTALPSGGSTRPPPSRSATCVLSAFNTAWSCPAAAECFDALTVTDGAVRAASRPCAGTHTWETFAFGSLPEGTAGKGPDAVRADPAVRALCSQVNLFVVDPDAIDLQVEVLPPAPEEISAGNRTFRCLAGKPPAQLTGPTLPIGG